MAFFISPGVQVREFDISTVVLQAATASAAYVGSFEWGPVNEITTISTKPRLMKYFGQPTDENSLHWFSCANFLDYSNNLKVVRVVNEEIARNATVNGYTKQQKINEILENIGNPDEVKYYIRQQTLDLPKKQAELDKIDAEKKVLERNIVALEDANVKIEQEIQALQSQILIIEGDMIEPRGILAGLDTDMQMLLEEKADLEAELEAKKGVLTTLEEDLENIKNLINNLKKEKSNNEINLASNRERVTQLENQAIKLGQQIDTYETNITGYENAIAGARGELTAKNTDKAGLESDLAVMTTAIGEMKTQLAAIVAQAVNAENNLTQLKKDLAALKTLLATRTATASTLRGEISGLETTKRGYETSKTDNENLKQEATTQLGSLQTVLDDKTTALETLEGELDDLNEAYILLQQDTAAKKAVMDGFLDAISEKEGQIATNNELIADEETAINALDTNSPTYDEDKAAHEATIQELEEANDALQAEINAIKDPNATDKLVNATNLYNAALEAEAANNTEKTRVNNAITAATAEKNTAEGNVANQNRLIEGYQTQINALTEQIENITTTISTKQGELTTTEGLIEETNQDITNKEADITTAERTKENQDALVSEKQAAISQKQTEINTQNDLIATAESEIRALQRTIDKNTALIETTRVQINNTRESITATEQTIASTQNKITSLEDMIAAATNQIDEKTTEKTTKESEIEQARTAVEEQQDLLEEHIQSIDEKQVDIDGASKTLLDIEARKVEAQNKIANNEAQISTNEKTIYTNRQAIESKKNDFAKAKAELEDLEASITANKDRLAQIEIDLAATDVTMGDDVVLINNQSHWTEKYSYGQNGVGEFAAKYPSVLGNNISIHMADINVYSAVTAAYVANDDVYYYSEEDYQATLVLDGDSQEQKEARALNNGEYALPVTFSYSQEGANLFLRKENTAKGHVVLDPTPNDAGYYKVKEIVIDKPGFGYKIAPDVTLPTTKGRYVTVDKPIAYAQLWKYANQFLSPPNTTNYTKQRGGSNDELHIVVVDETGVITGVKGQVLERFAHISKASDARFDDNSSAYYVAVLRDQSQYIWWMDHPKGMINWGREAQDTDFVLLPEEGYSAQLGGGVSGSSRDEITNAHLMRGWQNFTDTERVDVGILIGGPADRILAQYIVDIAETRMDAVAVISPEMNTCVKNPGNELQSIIAERGLLRASSYGFMDCNWKYQYDMYNDTYRWLPCNPDIAGIMARTDYDHDPWWSPAGFNRGHIKNVVKLAWDPDKTDRDELYSLSVNPVCTFLGEGTILYGDKTMLLKTSAFSRINVRRLFIVLEKSISTAAKYMLFEFNDEFTRTRFKQMVEPFLRDVQGRRGIIDFLVVCDESNNTPQVIDSNAFVGDIYIKPNRTINFIQLNFVAVATGVAFDEVVGTFGDF